jgi:Carboxypeptidase regulatory-like domain
MDRKRIGAIVGALGAVVAAVVVVILARERPPELREAPGPEAPVAEASARPESREPAPESRGAAPLIRPAPFAGAHTGVAGRVVAEDGAPIAGATVKVGEWFEGSTDELGRFDAAGLEGETCNAYAEARGFACTAVKGIRLVPGEAVPLTIVLHARPDRTGRVIGPDEAPVAEAAVAVVYGRLLGLGMASDHEISRTTGLSGWFSFPSCEGDMRVLEVRAGKAGVGAGKVNAAALLRVDEDEPVIIQLHRVRRLTLRFVPDDGSPPPAEVRFSIRDGSYWAGGRTDAQGVGTVPDFPTIEHFRVEADVEKRWRVVAKRSDPWRRSFDVAAAGDVEVTVPISRMPPEPEPGTVEGIVTDAAGRPAAGFIVNSSMPVPKGLEARTDGEGRFRLTGITPVKNCRVGARRGRGPMTWSDPFEIGAGGTKTGVRISLRDDPELRVDVVGPDGRRASGVVVVVDEDPDSAEGQPPSRATATTDALGRAEFRGLLACKVRISVDPASLPPGVGLDDGDRPAALLYYERPSGAFVLRLRHERVFVGVLALEDGSPVEGTITFRTYEPKPAFDGRPLLGREQTAAPQRGPDRHVRTGPLGEFTLRALSLWEYVPHVATRVARGPGADEAPETLDPVALSVLATGERNLVVVKRRED